MRKLTIVVTCTDRKSSLPAPGLRVRDLPDGSVQTRSKEWVRRVGRAKSGVALRDLYRGESWSQVETLVEAARSANYSPDLFVMSAGLGCQPIDALAVPYAATFSPGHDDSVAGDVEDCATWWAGLAEVEGSVALNSLPGRRTLLVLSEAYARATEADLRALGARGGEVLVIGGARDVPGVHRLKADRTLRSAMGGTMTSLNVRTASAWLRHKGTDDLYSDAARQSWDRWSAGVSKSEAYHRQPLTDAGVRRLIVSLRKATPGLSKSAALRLLRDQGFACEQTRFAAIFSDLVGAS